MKSVKLEKICYNSNKKQILSDISIKATPQNILCILGPSGAGKSCLMDIIVRKRKATSGSVVLDKNDRIAYVNQDIILNPYQTVHESINLYNRLMNKIPIDDTIIHHFITEFGLWEKRNMLIGSTGIKRLSGGEKKRVSILCGLAMNPDILLLDEPTSGLDSKSAWKIINFIKNYIEQKNIICVCSIHQPQKEIWDLINDVLVLEEGKQLYFGPSIDVKSDLCPRASDLESVEIENQDLLNFTDIALVSQDITPAISDVTTKQEPSTCKKIYILINRSLLLYSRNRLLLCLKFFLIMCIGVFETVLLGSASYILNLLITKDNIINYLRFVAFVIVKSFNVSILPISSISLFFENKEIQENELQNKLYNHRIYFGVTMFVETIIQIITSTIYALITWLPRNKFCLDYFGLYILVILTQTFIANSLVQCTAAIINNRDLSLIVISGYLSLSFLLLIGGNINYHNEFFGILQFFSVLKYPTSILLLGLYNLTNKNNNLAFIINAMNIDDNIVFKLGITGHFLIMISFYLLLNTITYAIISRKFNFLKNK